MTTSPESDERLHPDGTTEPCPADPPSAGGTPAPFRFGPFAIRRAARGDWSEILRDPIDVLRLSLALGAVVMLVAGDLDAATRLATTFVAVVLGRALDPPRSIDLVFTLGMSLQGWGNALDLFELWPWYNKVVHYVLPFGASAILYVLLARLEVVHDLEHQCTKRQTLGVVLVTLAIGFTVGGFYEIWEWGIHHGFDAQIIVGYNDTMTDMIDNALGSLTGGIVLALWARRGWGTRRRPVAHTRLA